MKVCVAYFYIYINLYFVLNGFQNDNTVNNALVNALVNLLMSVVIKKTFKENRGQFQHNWFDMLCGMCYKICTKMTGGHKTQL